MNNTETNNTKIIMKNLYDSLSGGLKEKSLEELYTYIGKQVVYVNESDELMIGEIKAINDSDTLEVYPLGHDTTKLIRISENYVCLQTDFAKNVSVKPAPAPLVGGYKKRRKSKKRKKSNRSSKSS